MPMSKLSKPRYHTLFLIAVVMYLTGGLWVVDEHAANEARKTAKLQVEIQRYNSNKTGCGLRKLVDLPNLRKVLKTYENAEKDPKLAAAAKKRNASRIVATKKQIKNGEQVISLFGLIPPDFDCKTLPKKPPEA